MFKPHVAWDRQRRTVIAVAQEGPNVKFIPLSYEFGLQVELMPATEFRQLYEEVPDYPIERAAGLYVGYAHSIGASEEALEHLGRYVKLTAKDIEMATKTPAKTAKTPAAKKAAAPKAEKAPKATKAAAAPAKATKAPKEPKAEKAKAPRAPSAASRFKELILEGKLSDDKIFEKVQKEFSLDDSKRSYVAWYRNDLTKKGLLAPAK